MGKVSKGKQTKAFLKKGLLDSQIKKRHEVRAFKQKVKGRQVQRNKGHGAKPDAEAEAESDSDEAGPVKKDASDSEEDEMDVDAVLGGEGVEDVRFLRFTSVVGGYSELLGSSWEPSRAAVWSNRFRAHFERNTSAFWGEGFVRCRGGGRVRSTCRVAFVELFCSREVSSKAARLQRGRRAYQLVQLRG